MRSAKTTVTAAFFLVLHVIAKSNIGSHTTVPFTTIPVPLRDGQVRIRSAMISLTNNNLSYAQLGTPFKWWDAYPVPSSLPAPYNDRDAWGIVPAWGYAEVVESKVPGLEEGVLVWGFWATGDLPIDFQMEKVEGVEGQWVEVSSARAGLMSLYNRYFVRDGRTRLQGLGEGEVEKMEWETAVRPVWEAGYLLNHAIFGREHIHPSGEGEWSLKDASLKDAVVVSLAASGKTALAFAEAAVCGRETGEGPLGFLAVTSAGKKGLVPEGKSPTMTVEYARMAEESTMEWIEAQRPKKIVLADFGGRGSSLQDLHQALAQRFDGVEIMVIGVGGNPEIRTAEQLGQWAQQNAMNSSFERIRMNTSGVRETLLKNGDANAYFQGVDEAWGRFRQSSCVSDLKLQLGHGIAGDDGFEGGWTAICEGRVKSDVAMAYRV
ncbi:uncharacterized protein LTR77_006077 [Saxophila tyrrhenica]|uniref:Uncharacterized protein n=1 Tax=Saxophila tyrrhenica TaxID=1690608 RepID=A0AAV9P7P9_9PEZI|nr:hypothetical protein LTR77_006077 [Saxophila tyrrhenica]